MSDILLFGALDSRSSSELVRVQLAFEPRVLQALCQRCHIDVMLDSGVTSHTWVVFVLSLFYCMASVSLSFGIVINVRVNL